MGVSPYLMCSISPLWLTAPCHSLQVCACCSFDSLISGCQAFERNFHPREGVTMTLQIRRVVTGHDQNGRAIVSIDEMCKNVISRRPSHSSCVVWSTGELPTDTGDNADGGTRPVATVDPNRTVFRLVEDGPGVAPRNHRTESIDYAVVISGAIDMDLDGTVVQLKAGDVLVQRGTIHNWVNRGTEPCVVAFVLVAAKPVERAGKSLTATN